MYKYEEIVRDIESAIANGTLKPYSKLPSVAELCLSYDVSRSTINQVLQTLSDEGLVARKQGSGIYVKPLDASTIGWKMAGESTGYHPRADKVSEGDAIGIVDFTVVRPEARICRVLDIDPQSFVYLVTRIHSNQTFVTCIEYFYLPIGFIGQLGAYDVVDDIVGLIKERTGLSVDSYRKTVRSIMPSNTERAQLRIEMETPLLEVETVGFLSDGRALYVSAKRFPGTRFEFKTVGSTPDVFAITGELSASSEQD